MATLSEIEEGMRKNDEEIEACLQLYTGMSWSEYYGSVGGAWHMIDLTKLRLPPGMMDAAEFLKTITEKELLLTQCKEQTKACIQQIAEMEKAEALIGQAIHHNGFGNGFGRHNVKAQLIHVRELRVADEKRLTLELWNYAELKTVDAVSFQAELPNLLKRKMELKLSHKKSIALRMMELRGDAPTAR